VNPNATPTAAYMGNQRVNFLSESQVGTNKLEVTSKLWGTIADIEKISVGKTGVYCRALMSTKYTTTDKEEKKGNVSINKDLVSLWI
jgi:hypothetical protein